MIKKKYILIGLIIATVYAIAIIIAKWAVTSYLDDFLKFCLWFYAPVIIAFVLNLIFRFIKIKNQIIIKVIKFIFYTLSIIYILLWGLLIGILHTVD